MRETFLNIFAGTLPTVIICSVIAITLRITYLFKYRKKFHVIREFLSLTFIIYIICLFYAVTFQDIDGSWATSNFEPFKEMFRYSFGSRLFIKNVLGNMMLFVPHGFFTSYFLKEKKPLIILVLTLVLSFTIEFIQLQIGRVFDIDDILLNLMGGFIGYFIYYLFYRFGTIFSSEKEEEK